MIITIYLQKKNTIIEKTLASGSKHGTGEKKLMKLKQTKYKY